jgi:hypothetical protein
VLLITRYGLRTCFITCNPRAELSCRELSKGLNTIVTRLLSSTLPRVANSCIQQGQYFPSPISGVSYWLASSNALPGRGSPAPHDPPSGKTSRKGLELSGNRVVFKPRSLKSLEVVARGLSSGMAALNNGGRKQIMRAASNSSPEITR